VLFRSKPGRSCDQDRPGVYVIDLALLKKIAKTYTAMEAKSF
jgi:hypothetical protein